MNNIHFHITNIGNAEIDKFASRTYDAIHRTNGNIGDVTQIDFAHLPEDFKDVDFLFAGSPCQDISTAGKQGGVIWTCGCGLRYNPLTVPPEERDYCPRCHCSDSIDKTRSSLLIYYLEAVRQLQPKVTIFENVAALAKSRKFSESFNDILSEIGRYGYNTYHKIMNAKDYGIPQNRERVIVVAIRQDVDNGRFKFPEPTEMKNINDLLDDNSALFRETEDDILIDPKIAPYVRANIEREKEQIIRSDKGIYRLTCTSGYQDNAVGIKHVPALRAQNPSTIALQTINADGADKYYIKRLTPVEAFRFMGFTDEDYRKAADVVSKSQIYKQAGNSIVVNVVQAVLQEIFNAMPFLFENGRMFHLFSGIGAFEKAVNNIVDAANAEHNMLRCRKVENRLMILRTYDEVA